MLYVQLLMSSNKMQLILITEIILDVKLSKTNKLANILLLSMFILDLHDMMSELFKPVFLLVKIILKELHQKFLLCLIMLVETMVMKFKSKELVSPKIQLLMNAKSQVKTVQLKISTQQKLQLLYLQFQPEILNSEH